LGATQLELLRKLGAGNAAHPPAGIPPLAQGASHAPAPFEAKPNPELLMCYGA